ncbi:MAG TPA: sigma-70 family RNA polymerase sigma factor [Acidimicrobiales bacterium]
MDALVTRAPEGFVEAFDALLLRAYRVAHRIVPTDQAAEDIAAETLMRAYAHWRRIGNKPWREGWVVRVATNLAIDAVRKMRPLSDGEIADGAAPDEQDSIAIRLALAAALRALPRRQREAVALRYLAGFSEAEAATALRISTGSVKTHLHRGLGSLRVALQGLAPDDLKEALDV